MSVLDQFSLGGKRALVTGSSRGLGKAIAIALAEAGADVVCASSKAGGADETAKSVESVGRKAWTASADLQFFAAYPALAARCSFIGIDHRGHGRGMRPSVPFTLEDCADDAAALVRALGVERVIPVGYSMGGPISLLLTRAHPDLVQAIIVQATALTFADSGLDRLRWRTIRLVGPLLRSWAYPRSVRAVLRRLLGDDHDFREYSGWIAGEINRNEALAIVQAGKALSLYDARPWASSLRKRAGSLITTNDHLVKPRHQRALARALGATVEEIDADHLAALVSPTAYIAATLRLIDAVTA